MRRYLVHIAYFFTFLMMVMTADMVMSQASAQGALQLGTAEQRCQQFKAEGVLVPYIVRCVEMMVREALVEFITQFYPMVVGTVEIVMILGVTLFGTMVAIGALEKTSRDTFVTLFKFSAIIFFIQPDQVLWLFNSGMTFLEELTDMVFQWGKLPMQQGRCMALYGGDPSLWQRVECMIDVTIGIAGKGEGGPAANGELEGISRGMFHFLMTNMTTENSGGLSPLMGGLGFYVAYTILKATIKSIHTYLAAILGLGFMLVLSPIFVPLIFFKVTRTYFDKWMRICGSFILQPVILFGFLSFMMIVMDQQLFNFTGTVAGEDCARDQNCFIAKRLADGGADVRTKVGAFENQAEATEETGEVNRNLRSVLGAVQERSRNQDVDLSQDSSKVGFKHPFHGYDTERWAQIAGAGDVSELLSKASASTFTLALTAFVFLSMLKYIPNLATDLSGGIYEVPNLYKQIGEKIPGLESSGGGQPGGKNPMEQAFRDQQKALAGRRGKR